jgi:hypothetical protein
MQKGLLVLNSLRRRIVAVLALAIGLGILGAASASAKPANVQVTPASSHVQTVNTASDWWW